SAGAAQMGVLRRVLTAREWWKHVPDPSVFALGAGGDDVLNAAARSTDGDSVIVYLSHPTTVSLRMDRVTAGGAARARWVNPETGDETSLGRLPTTGTHSFTTP